MNSQHTSDFSKAPHTSSKRSSTPHSTAADPSSAAAKEASELTVVGLLIGIVGCIIITASSVYTALKMGALPWPTIFTSITALTLLRAFGHRSLNEANVTQIIMSAGSMVAGGLAFTIPAAWMLGMAERVSWPVMLLVALSGTLLGLSWTALFRRRLVERSGLEYPIGIAAAQTLKASTARNNTTAKLFGSMAAAGLWSVARDVWALMPPILAQLPIPGVAFGVYNSPMMLSIGFLVGGSAVAFWLAGALFANFGLTVGATALGLWDLEAASRIVPSLGMGLMMGSGLGVIVKNIIPQLLQGLRESRTEKDTFAEQNASSSSSNVGGHNNRSNGNDGNSSNNGSTTSSTAPTSTWLSRTDAGGLALLIAAAALLICFGLGMSALATCVLVALSFVTTIMSAQSVGQTGIDPMEIFGLIVLLAVAALGEADEVKLFFVAGIVAVACGLAGDVMSDFKTGQLLGTSPRAMWKGQAIGALLGCVVAVAVMAALLSAHGAEAFGPGKEFVSAQASVVATMVAGIPSIPAFFVGLAAGVGLYALGLPSMMLGLGIYLPLYLSLTAPLGAAIKVIYDRVRPQDSGEETGVVVASGLLGGESIVGVVIALMAVVAGLLS